MGAQAVGTSKVNASGAIRQTAGVEVEEAALTSFEVIARIIHKF
jgi:hypothetical protein